MKKNTTTKISKEQALKNLYGELNIIDGETRADGTTRKVKSIEPLVGAKTRSGNALDNDLLYIVEFEEGQGSAVLAADTRLDPVIAVLDTDVLTSEDFASDDMDDISAYMASMIGEYAQTTSSEPPFTWIPAPDDEYDTTYYYNIATILKTKWDQDAPFNDKVVEVYGEGVPAGCWPIALAQFIYHMSYNSIVSFDNHIYNMSTLRSLEFGRMHNAIAEQTVASFVYSIGQAINASYNTAGTSSNIWYATLFMNEMGYTSASYATYNSSAVFTKLGQNKVMLIRADDGIKGHAWVIDGGYHYAVTGVRYNQDGGSDFATIEYKKVHCNYGWNGKCDGYYTEGLFDVGVRNSDVDLSAGDYAGTNGNNLRQDIMIITY